MRHLVIGSGEVGTAIRAVLDCDIRDIEPHDGQYDVLHVCFPYADGFEDAVTAYAEQHAADLVVVHSTVPVGTCDHHRWVHSPVRGRHPHLEEGVRTFAKHFGGPRALEAAKPFMETGMPTIRHDLAATTEAGKLWELAMFGVEIAMEKRIHEWCEEHGLPWHEVYRNFGKTYNAGWKSLGEQRFVKPVLRHDPRPIGGHCVVESMPFLNVDWVDDMIAPYTDRENAPAGGTV